MDIRIYGKMLVAAVQQFISGRTAKDKHLSPICWRYSNRFLTALLQGYLHGDGHWDEKNERWRLGFTRNYNLERDLRTLAARLELHLVLNPTTSTNTTTGKAHKSFKGEIRYSRSGHHNEKDTVEIVSIGKARCREVYDIGVADEPHLFALASGILSHNSKPNPMPESVTDRPTRSHEYIFLLSKSAKYYYDYEAIKEPIQDVSALRLLAKTPVRFGGDKGSGDMANRLYSGNAWRPNHKNLQSHGQGHSGYTKADGTSLLKPTRNKRDVWTVATQPYKGAHFAVFPEALITPCVLAGCPVGGVVLDPFAGSGTTLAVAKKHDRRYIGIELNESYLPLIQERLVKASPPKKEAPKRQMRLF